jgi:hypothetical protein
MQLRDLIARPARKQDHTTASCILCITRDNLRHNPQRIRFSLHQFQFPFAAFLPISHVSPLHFPFPFPLPLFRHLVSFKKAISPTLPPSSDKPHTLPQEQDNYHTHPPAQGRSRPHQPGLQARPVRELRCSHRSHPRAQGRCRSRRQGRDSRRRSRSLGERRGRGWLGPGWGGG